MHRRTEGTSHLVSAHNVRRCTWPQIVAVRRAHPVCVWRLSLVHSLVVALHRSTGASASEGAASGVGGSADVSDSTLICAPPCPRDTHLPPAPCARPCTCTHTHHLFICPCLSVFGSMAETGESDYDKKLFELGWSCLEREFLSCAPHPRFPALNPGSHPPRHFPPASPTQDRPAHSRYTSSHSTHAYPQPRPHSTHVHPRPPTPTHAHPRPPTPTHAHPGPPRPTTPTLAPSWPHPGANQAPPTPTHAFPAHPRLHPRPPSPTQFTQASTHDPPTPTMSTQAPPTSHPLPFTPYSCSNHAIPMFVPTPH